MNGRFFILGFFVLFSIASQAINPSSYLSSGNVPRWCDKQKVDYASTQTEQEIANGCSYLLVETQAHAVKKETYHHIAYQITNSSGIENHSEISVNFDPSFQKVVFYSVKVMRNGTSINKLFLNKFKVIQRESSLEMHLYDGSMDAYLILEDIRVGDIIEYEYTVIGSNPIYDDKFHLSFYLQYTDPVKHLFSKCIYDEKRPLYYKTIPASKEGKVKISTGSVPNEHLAYVQWQGLNMPSVITESNVPEWYSDYPFVVVSEYKTWEELAKWASNVFAMSKQTLPENFKQKMNAWKKSTSNKKMVVDSLLLFVKDSIRYMGIEMGENAIRPTAPSVVLARRFGDCKDKSVLLATALKDLGFVAYPALVNSYSKSELASWTPSSIAFNHCIVYARIMDRDYWFDPTVTGQRGSFEEMYTPNYKLALIVKEETKELKKIDGPRNCGIKIVEDFLIPEFHTTARLKVKSEYLGIEADNQRTFFRENIETMKKNYENYYSSQYKNIRITDLTYEDIPASNTFLVFEEYEIDSLWVRDTTKTQHVVAASFYPLSIGDKLSTASTANRISPFRLEHPLHIEQVTNIYLPEEWSVTAKPLLFDNQHFKLEHTMESKGRTVIIKTFYSTKSEEVAPEDFKKFNQEQTYISNNLGHELTYNFDFDQETESDSNKNWLLIGLFIMFLLFGGYACVKLYAHNPKTLIEEPEQWPIGGVLFFIALGLAISPFRIAYELLFTDDFFSLNVWNYWMTPNSEGYSPMAALVLVFQVFYNALLITFSVLLNVLFYQRRTSFPKFIIYFYITNLATNVLFEFISYSLNNDYKMFEDTSSYIQMVFSAGVWCPYFYHSRRVNHTFGVRL